MFKTYCSWILIAGIGFIVVFLGRIPTIVGVTLLAIYAFKEFANASGLYRDSWMTGAVYTGIITVGIAALISPPRGEEQGTGWYGFFVAVPAFAIALILLIPILRNRARGERVDEGSRREDAGNRMPPTQQCFGADHCTVLESDLRLEIKLELAFGVGAPQFEIKTAPRLCLRTQDRQEESIGAPA